MSNKNYDIYDISTKFNKTLKKLIINIGNTIKDNILFDTIQRRVTILTKEHPLFLLEEAGQKFFKYRDYIREESEELFLNLEDTVMNTDEIQEYIEDKNDKDSLLLLLTLVKGIWVNYTKEEKKYIQVCLRILLSEYCKYLTVKN